MCASITSRYKCLASIMPAEVSGHGQSQLLKHVCWMQPTAPLDTLCSLPGSHRVSPVLISALSETVELLSNTVRSRREQAQQPSPSPLSWNSSEAWSLEEDEERQVKMRERKQNPCRGDYGRRLAYDRMLKKRRERASLNQPHIQQKLQPQTSASAQMADSYTAQLHAWKTLQSIPQGMHLDDPTLPS